MNTRYSTLYIFIAMLISFIGCTQQQVTEMKHFPVDSMDGILTLSDVQIDKEISSDGNGSLRVATQEPTVVRLFEINNPDIENASLIYRARVRSKDFEGLVLLEMWCSFPGKGEFFSRNVQSPLTGTTEWTTEETAFFLYKGENPDYIKLNLVVNGKGTAWIDDIHLLKDQMSKLLLVEQFSSQVEHEEDTYLLLCCR